jgi:hypothetical protein
MLSLTRKTTWAIGDALISVLAEIGPATLLISESSSKKIFYVPSSLPSVSLGPVKMTTIEQQRFPAREHAGNVIEELLKASSSTAGQVCMIFLGRPLADVS